MRHTQSVPQPSFCAHMNSASLAFSDRKHGSFACPQPTDSPQRSAQARQRQGTTTLFSRSSDHKQQSSASCRSQEWPGSSSRPRRLSSQEAISTSGQLFSSKSSQLRQAGQRCVASLTSHHAHSWTLRSSSGTKPSPTSSCIVTSPRGTESSNRGHSGSLLPSATTFTKCQASRVKPSERNGIRWEESAADG